MGAVSVFIVAARARTAEPTEPVGWSTCRASTSPRRRSRTRPPVLPARPLIANHEFPVIPAYSSIDTRRECRKQRVSARRE